MTKKFLISLFLLFSYFGIFSWGIVLTFDDITTSQNAVGHISSNYNGFNLTTDTNQAMDWIDTVGSSWPYGSVSGEYTALNNYGGNAIIRAYNGSTFTFSSVYARIWGTGSRSVSIVGYRSGSSVWSGSYTLDTIWRNFAGNSSVVLDELRLNFSNHFLIDNLALSEVTSSPALSASNTNFGNVRVGSSATASVTVTNTGTSGSTLTGNIGPASGSEFSPASGSQSFSLSQNQSASRTYTYTPSARGADSTTVSVTSNATNTNLTLTGTGVSPVYASSVAPGSTIDFGTVDKDQTITQALTIQNATPDADLGNLTNMTLLSATISGQDASYFSISGFTPGTVLSKNGSFQFFVSVSNPDYYIMNRYATLTIVTDVNAALGVAGNVYTYQLVAYTVPEPSSIIFLSVAGLFLVISRFSRK